MNSIFSLVISIFIAGHLIGCAGPMTPFGGDILIGQRVEINSQYNGKDIKFKAKPDRQYYNSPYDLTIEIIDPNFDSSTFRYEVVYNNRVLNRWLKSEEIKFPKIKTDPIEITFKNLSILPGNMNKIDFLYYPSTTKVPVVYHLKIPECSPIFKNDLLTKKIKGIPNEYKDEINSYSAQYKYNPSMIAGLIAQESSFNPRAISFAKALGLTQITPMAHKEVKRFKQKWKIYPKFNDLSLRSIKRRLKNNKINSRNDWRLDPEKSIEGGIVYLEYLKSYWEMPDKQEILEKAFFDEPPMVDIILASYNSGGSRVKYAIKKNKKNWLQHKKLKEAKKYVMNIKSYCYSFNQGSKL